ncbi:hypothetical protein DM02DRAFT_650042 [Periconia macrospinosa]|uniref:Protein HRI1 n=1 Tax=Periconia macrospinosa TaxID=97972 RepID=A0A2V1E6F0_9PLEO|nr:hypothetical protein DM02DRAFT_650042 [Periconia macrospinosa]
MTSAAAIVNDATSQPDPREASISVRNYIYLLPHPIPVGVPVPYTLGLPDNNPLNLADHAFEPTNTLVLTSIKKTFVDIRIFRPIQPSDPEFPNTGGPLSRLDWAFSGTSSSVPIADPYSTSTGGSHGPDTNARTWSGPVKRASWTHWVDSRHPVGTPEAQIPVDTGLMFPINAMQVLEHGAAPNPQTGVMQSHEEMWTDCVIQACAPQTTVFSIVLRIDVPEYKVRGVVVRLGQFCQGIVMQGGAVTVERWEFLAGEWKRTVRIGEGFLPCALAFKEEACDLGGTVVYGQHEWKVEEKVEWSDVTQHVEEDG